MGRRLRRAVTEAGPRLTGWRSVCLLTLAAIACGVAVSLVPLRFEVDGLSMGPGLLPGDVVVVPPGGGPLLRRPRRQERWVLVAGDGTRMVKRIVGLPGETLRLVDGDVEADGCIATKGPADLATCGSVVVDARGVPGGRWEWNAPPEGVLDDAAFDPERTRLVEPVSDIGLAVIVTVIGKLPATGRGVRLEAGSRRVVFRVHDESAQACVVGRLDGRLVAAAWRVVATLPRSCLPGGSPSAWEATEPWATDDAVTRLCVEIEEGLRLERVMVWRDVHLVPAANGIRQWQLGPQDYFAVGDHPAGSRDSRHFGPLSTAQLVGRIVTKPMGR